MLQPQIIDVIATSSAFGSFCGLSIPSKDLLPAAVLRRSWSGPALGLACMTPTAGLFVRARVQPLVHKSVQSCHQTLAGSAARIPHDPD
jgi:hypothetical protein